MRLASIALRNMRQHPSRSALLLLAISSTVAVVTTLYLVTRSAERDLANRVDEYGANIVVVPRTKDLPLTYGGVQLGGLTYQAKPLHLSDIVKIRSIKNKRNINMVAPKLVDLAVIRGVQLLAVGVQWDQELGLKKWWKLTGAVPSGDHDLLVGSRAMQKLGLSVGDSVNVKGERFRVVSSLGPTGTEEDDVVFMDLGTAQRLWKRPGQLSFIEVSAFCSSCPIEKINSEISAEMPYARVSAVLKAAESRKLLVDQFHLFSFVLSAVMIIVGCLIVLTSTLSGVRDRRNEIGVFRSVGYRRKHILRIILFENLALALFGGGVGIIAAALAAGPLARGGGGGGGGRGAAGPPPPRRCRPRR
jgi:putative ABC transport system permease protein